MRTEFYSIITILIIFNIFPSRANAELNSTASLKVDDKSKVVNIAKVNNHTITNKVFGKNSDKYIKLDAKRQNILKNKLIHDELLVQYIIEKYKRSDIDTLSENKRMIKGIALIEEKLFPKILKNIEDNNLSLKFYNENKKRYTHSEDMFEASTILVKSKKEAEDVIERLNKSSDVNRTFIQLSKEKSLAKFAKNGGYIGFFEKKIMPKPFGVALEKMKIGEYTKEPIKTENGYHVILLHSIEAKGEAFSFKKLNRDITLYLIKKEMDRWGNNKVKELIERNATVVRY